MGVYAGYCIAMCLALCHSAVAEQKMDKGAIGFPESEENPKSANKQNRQPVYLPAKCAINELYYPGDQEADWICDCRPGYLYHLDTARCWLAYQRGPCPSGQYLTLPRSSAIPICVNNPCISDNMVMFQGRCVNLGAMAPCGLQYPPRVVWVNATSIEVDCVRVYADNPADPLFNANDIRTLCPNGCRRSLRQQCLPDPRK